MARAEAIPDVAAPRDAKVPSLRQSAQAALDTSVNTTRLTTAAAQHAAARAKLQSLVLLADACPTGRTLLVIDGVAASPVEIPCGTAQAILDDLIVSATADVETLAEAIALAVKVLP